MSTTLSDRISTIFQADMISPVNLIKTVSSNLLFNENSEECENIFGPPLHQIAHL